MSRFSRVAVIAGGAKFHAISFSDGSVVMEEAPCGYQRVHPRDNGSHIERYHWERNFAP
jgi:hypothetical protein